MFKPGRLQRLLAFTLKPLLAALTLTLLIRSFSSSSPKSTINKGAKFHLSQHLIIASTTTSNLTWLTSLPSKNLPWKPHIYVTDTTTPPANTFTVPINKGNEAMAYLTYIIDNYRSLPDIMFFHHDHHQAWHQSFSSSFELSHLNPTTVLSQGYVSPRCLPGCENIIELSGDVVPLSDLRGTSRDVQISTILHNFLGRVPEKIAAPCCAQFAVSRERVLRRSLEGWRELREWLVQTELPSLTSGRVLEWTWHLWFGQEDVFCPEEAKCLCDVFGVGDCS